MIFIVYLVDFYHGFLSVINLEKHAFCTIFIEIKKVPFMQ
jgi:hypothetical protein